MSVNKKFVEKIKPKIEELFDAYDINKDGEVSYEEIKICYGYLPNPEEDSKQIHAMMDMNQDGKVTVEDMLLQMEQLSLDISDEQVDEKVAYFNSEMDKTIEEIKEFRKKTKK